MISVTTEEYQEYEDEMVGFCLECEEIHYECESDCRKRPCESCGAKAVYGIGELLIMGELDITE